MTDSVKGYILGVIAAASYGTNTRACEAVCPKNETIANIARLNREMIKAKLSE